MWPELIPGILIKRYKRFLADVKLNVTGQVVTAHCSNTGAMTSCCEPGRPVWLSFHDNPKRKLKYTWELIQMENSLTGVNTLVPNRLVAWAIDAGDIPELDGFHNIRREVTAGNSRIDLLLEKKDETRCFVEIKNCTLVENHIAKFPDAVSVRGQKHLKELQRLRTDTTRCVIFFLIQRMDAERFGPADHIDPEYGKILRKAVHKGVEALAYDVHIDLSGIRIRKRLPVEL